MAQNFNNGNQNRQPNNYPQQQRRSQMLNNQPRPSQPASNANANRRRSQQLTNNPYPPQQQMPNQNPQQRRSQRLNNQPRPQNQGQGMPSPQQRRSQMLQNQPQNHGQAQGRPMNQQPTRQGGMPYSPNQNSSLGQVRNVPQQPQGYPTNQNESVGITTQDLEDLNISMSPVDRMQNKKSSKKVKKKLDKKIVISVLTFVLVLCVGGVAWFGYTYSSVDNSIGDNLSADGLATTDKTAEVSEKLQEQFASEEEVDYTDFPSVEDGFGDVDTPKEITAFGSPLYKSSTEVFVLTKQTAAAIGVPSIEDDGVTTDDSGGFTWLTTYNEEPVEVGYVVMGTNIENYQVVYPEDSKRLRDYLQDDTYNWYKITLRSKSEAILTREEVPALVKAVFGDKLNPEGSVILYNGGYKYNKVTVED